MSLASDAEKELALKAHQCFVDKDYNGCLATLAALSKTRAGDYKVAHNIAVAEYCRSNFTTPFQFVNSLTKCRKDVHETALKQNSANSYHEHVESSAIAYNEASILCHLKQSERALAILERLFKYVEPIQESLAKKICLLLLDIYVKKRDTDKARGIVAYIERTFMGGRGETALAIPSPSPHVLAKSTDRPLISAPLFKDGTSGPSAYTGSAAAAEHERKEMEKRERREKSSQKTPSKPDQSSTHIEGLPLSQVLEYYVQRLQALTLTDQREDAPPASNGSLHGAFIQTEWHWRIGSSGTMGESLAPLRQAACPGARFSPLLVLPLSDLAAAAAAAITQSHYHKCFATNASGCFHHLRGEHSLAALAFAFALKENDALAKRSVAESNGVPVRNVQLFALDKHHELLYNYALQLLHTGDFETALACFQETLPVLSSFPYVWVRLAECCIFANSPRRASSTAPTSAAARLGSPLKHTLSAAVHLVRPAGPAFSQAGTSLALQDAVAYLQNALVLLSMTEVTAATAGSTAQAAATAPAKPAQQPMAQSPLPELPPHLARLRCAVLTKLAYVHLWTTEHALALRYSAMALEGRDMAVTDRFHALLIHTESLLMLGRVNEAAEKLSPDSVASLGLDLDQMDKQVNAHPRLPFSNGWLTGVQARATLTYNLVCAYILQGAYHRALQIVDGDSAALAPFALLRVFLLLKLGNTSKAVGAIRSLQG